MYKSRSASMQRGMRQHDRDATLVEIYTKETLPVLSKHERAHFQFGDRDKNSLLVRVRPLVRAYAKGGHRKPRDVSRLLNRDGLTTACGAKWTPRLAWFLLGFLFEEPKKDKSKNSRIVRAPSPSALRRANPIATLGRPPVSTEEIARRLAALGRIVRPD
jgi:hypothetical protein